MIFDQLPPRQYEREHILHNYLQQLQEYTSYHAMVNPTSFTPTILYEHAFLQGLCVG